MPTAMFAFSPATGASSVTLKLSTDGGTTWYPANVIWTDNSGGLNSESRMAQIDGLVAGTQYKAKLVVVGGSKEGDSNTEMFTEE